MIINDAQLINLQGLPASTAAANAAAHAAANATAAK